MPSEAEELIAYAEANGNMLERKLAAMLGVAMKALRAAQVSDGYGGCDCCSGGGDRAHEPACILDVPLIKIEQIASGK